MEFGVVSFDGVMGSSNTVTNATSGFSSVVVTSDPEAKLRLYGSGLLKQERSHGITTGDDDGDWRSSKLSKTSATDNESMLLRNTLLKSNIPTLFFSAADGQQMLSFSCPKSEALSVESRPQNATLPYFHLSTPHAYNRNTGYNYGSYNGVGMHGVFTEARGPFTQSQWMELEHQALIYKYITANVPIPPNLLIPIRNALNSAALSSFGGGLLRPNPLACGPFHLGFSGNADPEPGRCRRTDGKKWRCSRDAVADQKYCERHMNRGRHRSRKPVEGQSGHSVATVTAAKPAAPSTSISASVAGRGGSGGMSNSLAIAQHQQQFKNLQTNGSTNLSTVSLSRMFLNKDSERMQDAAALSMVSPNIDLKSKENRFAVSEQHKPYEETSRIEFGIVASDSLLNPSQKGYSFMGCGAFGSSQDLTNHETVSQHSLRQFMDDWPKIQSDRSAVSWPGLDLQSDRTQLSISVPMAPADFMSSTSSPNNENASLSPLRLSREFDPSQMGLGVVSVLNEPNQRQAKWIPISWESSMGGPLGEVLHNTSNNSSAAESKNTSALNLMTEGWDSSARLNSSPTGVLQKATFGSVSNSSAGSSPRAETNKTNGGVSLCNVLRGATLLHSSSLPAL